MQESTQIKLLELCEQEIEQNQIYQFHNTHWEDHTQMVFEIWQFCIEQYSESDSNLSFQEYFFFSIEESLEAAEIIGSHYDQAVKALACSEGLIFEFEDINDDSDFEDWRIEVSDSSRDEIILVFLKHMIDTDTSTIETSIKECRITLGYSPRLVGIEDSLCYGNNPDNFHSNEELQNALMFFNIKPQELKSAFDTAFSSSFDKENEWVSSMLDFETCNNRPCSDVFAVERISETHRHWIPILTLNITPMELSRFYENKTLKVQGGMVGCVDLVHGSGSLESMEKDHKFEIHGMDKIIPTDFINLSKGSTFGSLLDKTFNMGFKVHDADLDFS